MIDDVEALLAPRPVDPADVDQQLEAADRVVAQEREQAQHLVRRRPQGEVAVRDVPAGEGTTEFCGDVLTE